MSELLENQAFFIGMTLGISIYQQKVIAAHKRKEPLRIGDEIFYLQNGHERLEEFLEKACE